VDAEAAGHARFVNLFREGDSCARDGSHRVALEPYGYRWYRAGTLDREVARQD
jgi:maltose alpha-D-glucosyltransferase/alpha-amylase